MAHLTEEQLNLYLDQALSSEEISGAEAHFATCKQCQTELESLQTLFVALDALQPDFQFEDITPAVLGDIAKERRHALQRRRLIWGVLAVQVVAIILLLNFGRSSLSSQMNEFGKNLAEIRLALPWADTVGQINILWISLRDLGKSWGDDTINMAQQLPLAVDPNSLGWPKISGIEGTTTQIFLIGLAAGLMWLIGNYIFLRSNRHRSDATQHLPH